MQTNKPQEQQLSPQAKFEDSLKRILSLPKEKIEEYEREHKPFRKAAKANKPK